MPIWNASFQAVLNALHHNIRPDLVPKLSALVSLLLAGRVHGKRMLDRCWGWEREVGTGRLLSSTLTCAKTSPSSYYLFSCQIVQELLLTF